MSPPTGSSQAATSKLNGKAPASSHEAPHEAAANVTAAAGSSGDTAAKAKKKKHRRGGRKRKDRRQSFAAPSDAGMTDQHAEDQALLGVPEGTEPEASYFKQRRNSASSLESEALLDHRDHPQTRIRRPSVASPYATRGNPFAHRGSPAGSGRTLRQSGMTEGSGRAEPKYQAHVQDEDEDDDEATDRTPLMLRNQSPRHRRGLSSGYGGLGQSENRRSHLSARPASVSSSKSGKSSRRRRELPRLNSSMSISSYDVNNPPSVPGSPRQGADEDYDDVMLPEYSFNAPGDYGRDMHSSYGNEAVIEIDGGLGDERPQSGNNFMRRRATGQGQDRDDVCLPFEQMTEIGMEDAMHIEGGAGASMRRSRRRPWPDLSALEEWSRQEKEELSQEGPRAQKVAEPELVGGRLRPRTQAWRREQEEEPFRWTYFNEEIDSSLRSHTISGLQQLGLNFQELFIPDPPEIDGDSSDDEDEVLSTLGAPTLSHTRSQTPLAQHNGESRAGTRQSSTMGIQERISSAENTQGRGTPVADQSRERRKKYGPRPVFWLDVLQPTMEEMRVICRTFGIHKLTAEDIMEQEVREKVELFRNYYFVNYRTFEQDEKSEDYMEPVNMYFIVFKGGVISFHFSQMPHPPNVRRRIRQLAEHQYTDSDWISYAIIDNITDAYAPLIEQIESEVDDIDDEILRLYSKGLKEDEAKRRGLAPEEAKDKPHFYEKIAGRAGGGSDGSESIASVTSAETSRDMLVRVGECRKRVMGLYRLLGNKADVIKGLAKRCNEQWQVAPRSDVGLYLGDIQDHIVTMTGNLTHYENILSRAHSNYLAQINIRMNERAEQTNDVLGKLTVLGTIVLPMNIITGMWGMNVLVPGQNIEDLNWFWCITAGLLAFGLSCFFIAKKLYGVV